MIREEDPDTDWVQQLADCSESAARRAVSEADGERRLFQHIAREHASEGRTSYVEIDAPYELYAITRLRRPVHVVEVGVSSGVSSAYILQALERNDRGTLHSVDLPKLAKRPARGRRSTNPSWSLPDGRTSGWAIPLVLRKRWDLRLGNKRDVLPLLAEELSTVGLFVYDVPHDDSAALREFRLMDPLLPRGGVAIADHGPGGGMCTALSQWARGRGVKPVGRRGLGLYGFARP
jgi:hypothetical protein